MKIQVLGLGCAKCKKAYEMMNGALKQLGESAEIEKVEKMEEIVKYGVMMTPAVVVNGKVKCSGKVPTLAEATSYITSALAEVE